MLHGERVFGGRAALEWLKGAQRPPNPEPPPIQTGGNPVGTQAAADYAAQQKIQELQTSGEIKRFFAAIREPLGEFQYLAILAEFGVHSPDQFRDTEKARACYRKMNAALKGVS